MEFDAWVISRLMAHGAYEGVVDSVPGRQMTKALERFQKSLGLDVTGLANDETVVALRKVPGSPAIKTSAPVGPSEPVWMREARRFMGLREIAGQASSPVIMGWAKAFGGWISSFYKNDDTPWCGLFIGHVIAATLPNEPLPANPLSALAWAKFGQTIDKPCPGAILVFSRHGGGHVGLYVGEDVLGRYHVLGGNQSNSVSTTAIDKSRCVAIRWPKSGGIPPVFGRVVVTATGKTSANEA